VKEKKIPPSAQQWDENGVPRKTTRCTLKGSILIKKHLNEVTETGMGKTLSTTQIGKMTNCPNS
jgi:hypothetical protein